MLLGDSSSRLGFHFQLTTGEYTAATICQVDRCVEQLPNHDCRWARLRLGPSERINRRMCYFGDHDGMLTLSFFSSCAAQAPTLQKSLPESQGPLETSFWRSPVKRFMRDFSRLGLLQQFYYNPVEVWHKCIAQVTNPFDFLYPTSPS